MHGVSRTYWSRFLHKVYQLARCSTKHNRFEKIAFICMKINMKNKGFFRHETFVSTLHVETKQTIAQKRSNKSTKQSPFKLGQCLDMIASLNQATLNKFLEKNACIYSTFKSAFKKLFVLMSNPLPAYNYFPYGTYILQNDSTIICILLCSLNVRIN